MHAAILASDEQKKELATAANAGSCTLHWVNTPEEMVAQAGCKILVDLLFTKENKRIALLKKRTDALVIINSVTHTLNETDPGFVRISGWPGFSNRSVVEAAGTPAVRESTESFFACLGKRVQWLPDKAGFITARVIAMIINEAYLALGEGVSTKEEINTAMKLGTNYPYGPFEWAEKTGLQNVYELLMKLGETDKKYSPATALLKEIQMK